MSPRALSVRFTVGRFDVCLFWTFTFKNPTTPEAGAKIWDRLRRRLVREWPEARLVRVFELHPGGHGLHIHAATPDWLSVRQMLRHARAVGFGRIHVVKWKCDQDGPDAGDYLSKYLTKERPPCLKGKRLVGFINIPSDQVTRQCDVHYQSVMVDIWRILKSHPEWGILSFGQKGWLTKQAHRAWVNYDEPEAFQPRPAAGGAGMESLYLVISGTIRQGPETIARHLGQEFEFTASARQKIVDKTDPVHENGNWRAFFARLNHNQPTIEDEIRTIETDISHERYEAGTADLRDASRLGVVCPF